MARADRLTFMVAAANAAASPALVGPDRLTGLLQAKPAAAAERPAQPVRVTRVALVAPVEDRSFTGTVRPHHETAMAFRLQGKIIAWLTSVTGSLPAKFWRGSTPPTPGLALKPQRRK